MHALIKTLIAFPFEILSFENAAASYFDGMCLKAFCHCKNCTRLWKATIFLVSNQKNVFSTQ